MLRQLCLSAQALAVLPVDPDRALALLDDGAEFATRANLGVSIATLGFYRGLVLHPPSLRRRRRCVAPIPRRLARRGNRRGLLNVLSCVTGLADRTSRSATAAVLFDGLRATRAEYGLAGSTNEQRAEHTIGEHLSRYLVDNDVVRHVRQFDIESIVDLSLDTIDEIAIDSPA